MIDFTSCPIDKTANYGGSDKKRGIVFDKKKYMLKLSDEISESNRNFLNSSYTNSVISEDLSCRIIKSLGIDVQNTLLGTITIYSSKGTKKFYPAVACENFEADGYKLVEFKVLENALLDHKPAKTPHIEDIYEILGHDTPYFDKLFGLLALQRYWDTFVIDALLGNFDRHANNWGYLINDSLNDIKLAPIYDCGSCLYPQISDQGIDFVLGSKDERNKRINVFPTAALICNGKKVGYKDYISSHQNTDCTEALRRIFPKIQMENICKIVNETPGISDIRKDFYKVMISERYKEILVYSMEQIPRRVYDAASQSERNNIKKKIR